MDRIIGIDYGSARTGLAVSDPLQIFASALETLPSAKIIEYLQKYSASETIVKIVIGWPLNLNGEPAQTAPEVEAFIEKLEKAFPGVPVVREDERFTSVMAHQTIMDAGLSKSKRQDKDLVDTIAATIILQSYMESIKNKS